jgi:hypothetical protein
VGVIKVNAIGLKAAKRGLGGGLNRRRPEAAQAWELSAT